MVVRNLLTASFRIAQERQYKYLPALCQLEMNTARIRMTAIGNVLKKMKKGVFQKEMSKGYASLENNFATLEKVSE